MRSNESILHSLSVFQTSNNNSNFTPMMDLGFGGSSYNAGQSVHLTKGGYTRADIIQAVITRIALDASMVKFEHLKIDKDGNQSKVKSGLSKVLGLSANIDQTGRSFLFDVFYTLLEDNSVVLVPTETNVDPNKGTFDVLSARVGTVTQWSPKAVQVRVYNEETGLMQEVTLQKNACVIIESPFASILDDNNQTLRLLDQKVKLMNSQDSRAASGKINGFIRFPYATKQTSRRTQAATRKKEIEREMSDNKYGIATLDVNEEFVSAGGQIQNNLLSDIQALKLDFYNQMGISEAVLNGTADQAQSLTYYNRCVDVLLTWFVDAVSRVFISDTARTQGQTIRYYRDPFKLVPTEQLATIADILTRNAIYTPNEIRELTGKPPHPSALANELFNRNIADANQAGGISTVGQEGQGIAPEDAQQDEQGYDDYTEE